MLSGLEIKRQYMKGNLWISDFSDSQLNPNSYNLRLSDRLVVYNEGYLDPKRQNATVEREIPPDGYILHPGRLYLGSTIEETSTPNHVPCIEGRSSLGRLGLMVHLTAGFGDIGFHGHWTLELAVIQPMKVYAGMEICQIAYQEIVGEYESYSGRYQNQGHAPVESRYHL